MLGRENRMLYDLLLHITVLRYCLSAWLTQFLPRYIITFGYKRIFFYPLVSCGYEKLPMISENEK